MNGGGAAKKERVRPLTAKSSCIVAATGENEYQVVYLLQ